MPQLDPALFSPQIVWLAISFVALYFLMARLVLPRMSAVEEQREDRIQGNLARAEKIRQEAVAVLAAYDKAIAEARVKAHAALVNAAAEISAETARRQGEVAAKLAEQGAVAEARIREAKNRALADLPAIAGDVAAALAGKLTGSDIDAGQAREAVSQAMRERA
jgi:F-type H+-transporting ATPase subunit b